LKVSLPMLCVVDDIKYQILRFRRSLQNYGPMLSLFTATAR
jgi:hypothetical protein